MKSDVGSRRRDVFNPERNADQSRTKRWRWNKGGSGARLAHVHTRRSWIGFREDTDSSFSQRVKLLTRCDIPASRLLLACNLIAHTWRPSQHPLQGVFSLLMCASSTLTVCMCSSCAGNRRCVFFCPVLQKTAGDLLFTPSLCASMCLCLCTWVSQQTVGGPWTLWIWHYSL